jgi:hypothetical protein
MYGGYELNTFQITNKIWLQIKREIPFIDKNFSHIMERRVQNKKGNFIIRVEVFRV